MTSIIAIPSVIYLVLVFNSANPSVVIQEMPTMHVCESIGEWITRNPTVVVYRATYTCIESPRDE